MKLALTVLGIVWSTVFGIRALAFLLIPWWRGTWVPYFPRKARIQDGAIHFIAGRLIPKTMGGGSFVTGAQTHWFMVWFADEESWNQRQLVKHETRHTKQELIFGPLYLLLYVGHFLVNLVRYRNSLKAYREIAFERDARRHAGQQV